MEPEHLLRPDDEKRCSTALEVSRTGTFRWQVKADCFESDRFLCDLMGVLGDEAPRTLGDFMARLHEQDRSRFQATVQSALAGERELDLVLRVLLSEGRLRWLTAKARVFSDDQEELYLIGACTDITAFKVVEAELIRARRAADEASRAKSQFLANVSHEIRTPLTAVLGFAQLLREAALPGTPGARHADRIVANALRLEALVSDILDLEEVEAGRVQLDLRAVEVPGLVAEVAARYRDLAGRKGLEFETVFIGDLPAVVYTDPQKLKEILAHVLDNAVKFTINGTIRLIVQTFESKADPRRCCLDFVVADTGLGIDEDEAARIFQPFTQADETTTRLYGGAGIGLALARTLARTLGGDVSLAQSRPGQGSTFRVTVGAFLAPPPHVTVAAKSEALEAASDGLLKGRRLLIVEDVPEMQVLLHDMLRGLGASVLIADDGDEAVRLASTEPCELVLMDLQMPRLDGYATLRLLRSSGITVPVVALTCHASDSIRQATLAAGFDAFLTKPFDQGALVATILGLLEPPDASLGAVAEPAAPLH